MNDASWLWRVSALLGLLVAGVGLVTLGAFPTEGAGFPAGLGTPIYAFEMARSVQDLILIFGPEGDPARSARIAAMDTGNLWDYPFMLCYGLFIAFFFAAIARHSGQGLWRLFAVFGLAAAGADAIENLILLGITNDLAAAPGIEVLRYPVWLKFSLLAVCNAAVAAFLWRRGGVISRAVSLPVLAGAVVVIPAAVAPSEYGVWLGNGTAVGWIAMLVIAILNSVKWNAVV